MIATRQRNWRWSVVEELYDTGHSLKGPLKKDKHIAKAFDFWYVLQELSGEELSVLKSFELEEKFPEVYKAHAIYTDTSIEKFFIEALVMSGTSFEEIAVKVGVEPEVIETYEQLFFDVRVHLEKDLYIMGNILGPLFSYGATGTDYDHLWKAVGYFCGNSALESLWKFGKLTEEDRQKLDDILEDKLTAQAACSIFARQPNQYNVTEILSDKFQMENVTLAKIRADKTGQQSENYLEKIKGDVLEYTQLALKPSDEEFEGHESQLTTSNRDRDDYDRPAEFN